MTQQVKYVTKFHKAINWLSQRLFGHKQYIQEPNAFIAPFKSPDMSKAMAYRWSRETIPFDAQMERIFETIYKVWMYNVSKVEHIISHPTVRTIPVPACKEGEDYAVVTSFPNIIK